MELMLAVVVVCAVVFFGALISIGNERQRRAIDQMREEVTLWAVHDLQLKRTKFARDVKVDNPIAWFCEMVTKISGRNIVIDTIEFHKNIDLLVGSSNSSDTRVIFTTHSPKEVRRIIGSRKSMLTRRSMQDEMIWSLHNLPIYYDVSILNGGPFFDLELNDAWQQIVGRVPVKGDKMWIYLPFD